MKTLLAILLLTSMGIQAHTHNFGVREVTSYADVSTHQFTLVNRNNYTVDFAVLVDGKKIGTLTDVRHNEAVKVRVDLRSAEDTVRERIICTEMEGDMPNRSRVCSKIILKRY